MTRSVREMSAARWRSPDRKTSIAPRNMPSNMSAMRRVSRVAFASATLAVSSAPGSRWMGLPGSAGLGGSGTRRIRSAARRSVKGRNNTASARLKAA